MFPGSLGSLIHAILGLTRAGSIGAAKTVDLNFSGSLIAESMDLLSLWQELERGPGFTPTLRLELHWNI